MIASEAPGLRCPAPQTLPAYAVDLTDLANANNCHDGKAPEKLVDDPDMNSNLETGYQGLLANACLTRSANASRSSRPSSITQLDDDVVHTS